MINNYRYKAYISYSHRDEQWASWLHRALESYRVPRKLIGTETGVGEVPSRIRPVFRDRDDLSSASDLGGTVNQALADSENMIVVCSPEAVASFWVNEEIRQFASLGRQKQIFCIIVDGEPAGNGRASTCFPAALSEIGLQEPLAADARKWADGRRLSKLKLVAGMLGLPLDQLRRRDLQKRQKAWTLAVVAIVAAVVVLLTAITARIAAQQRRDSGESLVAYKLKELRTMLNVVDDPEKLGRLEQWDKQDLARLISHAGDGGDALLKSALVLRSEGNESWQNGDLTRSLEKYNQSWALLAVAYQRDRNSHPVFFELGQAEYYIGQTYLDQGHLDEAERAFTAYAEITRQLILLEPENAEWVLEMAYALTGLGNLQKLRDADRPERTLQFMQSSLEYNQIALVLDPANEDYRSELGQSHAFLAEAQLDVCDLDGALKSAQEQVALEHELFTAGPENSDRAEKMAFALTSSSSVKGLLGDIDGAIVDLKQALQLFENILLQDVNIREVTIEILSRQIILAGLMVHNDATDEAWTISNAMSEKWLELESISQEDMRTTLVYIKYLMGRASLAEAKGDHQLATQLLSDIQFHLAASQNNQSFQREAGNLLVQAAFQTWEINDELPPATILTQLPEYAVGSGRARSCDDAGMAMMKAVMLGQHTHAREFSEYLLGSGYREAEFMRVCKEYAICSGQ